MITLEKVIEALKQFIALLLSVPVWLSIPIVMLMPTVVCFLVDLLNGKFEHEDSIELNFLGIYKRKWKKKIPTVAPILRLIAQRAWVGVGNPEVAIRLCIENSGNAQAENIQCTIFKVGERSLGEIKREDENSRRTYDILHEGGKSTYYFAEDPQKVLHPSASDLRFAVISMSRSDAPFDIEYRLRASSFEYSGTLSINPGQMASG